MYFFPVTSIRVLKCLIWTLIVSTSSSGEYPQTSSSSLLVVTVCPWCCNKQCSTSNSIGVSLTTLSVILTYLLSGISVISPVCNISGSVMVVGALPDLLNNALTLTYNSGSSNGFVK